MSASSLQDRGQPCYPINPPGISWIGVSGIIVQLHNHAEARVRQLCYQLLTQRIERRIRRPGWRVEHSGTSGVEGERSQDFITPQGTIDQTICLWHADQPRCRTISLDCTSGHEIIHASAIDEEQPVPLA